jgi:hypothetical protein
VQGKGNLNKSTFCASAGGVALTRRGDGSVATVVARMASGKKVRIYENSRTIGAAILHIHAHERVPFRLFLIPVGAEHTHSCSAIGLH